MELKDFQYLISDEGQLLLKKTAASSLSEFALAAALRKETTPAIATAIMQTIDLRKKAGKKFPRADKMFFLRDALEQASAEIVASYRSKRYFAAGATHIADYCCSIGGDALSFCSQAAVTGIDISEIRLEIARYNIETCLPGADFKPLLADASTTMKKDTGADFFFIDPARRSNGKRIYDPELCNPPLSEIKKFTAGYEGGAIKTAPGIDHIYISDEYSPEFISVNSEVRECVLWCGKLREGSEYKATLLPEGISIDSGMKKRSECGNPESYIHEPDGAIIRAGLVEQAALLSDTHLIDPHIAFLTSEEFKPSPLLQSYRIIDKAEFNLKALRKKLNGMNAGSLNIKRRGFPGDNNELLHKLKLKGKEHFTLLLARAGQAHMSIIAERIPVSCQY